MSRWPCWQAWASAGLYVRVAPLPRLPSRQTFKHLFCVYDTEEEIKRPPGEKEEEKKNNRKAGAILGACQARWREENQVWDWFPYYSEQVASLGVGGEIQDSRSMSGEGGG